MRGIVGPAESYLFNTTDQTFFLHVGKAANASSVSEAASSNVAMGTLIESLGLAPHGDQSTIVLSASTPASVVLEIERSIATDGSLSQVYIPRGVAWNVSVTGAASVSQVASSSDTP